MRRRPFALGTAGLVTGALIGRRAAAMPAFSGLVVLGDSLSDSGNAGRFSDGPVWVEHLARWLGVELRPSRLGGTNHAVGGARAAGLRVQAEAVLAADAGRLDREALHVVWGGGNDLLAADPSPSHRPAELEAAAILAGIVADLAAAGARHFLVPNLPDIGHTPALRLAGPAIVALARQRTLAFNATLDRQLEAVQARAGVQLEQLDAFALADRVMADPRAFGFTETTRPCFGEACDGFLFWDQIHPSALAHAKLAAAAAEGLTRMAEEGPLCG